MQGAKHDSLFAHVSVAHSLLALLARIHDEWWTSPGSSCSKRRPFATWQPKLCDWSCAKRIKGVALQAIEESRRDFVSGVLLGEMANLVEFPKKKGSVKLHPQCVPPVHHAHFLHEGARCGGTTLISSMSEMCMMDNAEAVVLDDAHGPKTVKGSTAQAGFNLHGKGRYFVSGAIHSLLLSGRCTTVL